MKTADRKPETGKKLRTNDKAHRDKHGLVLMHWCPGCDCAHLIHVEKPNHCGAVWKFNGNYEQPTFEPSINLVGQCHYFIRSGKIEFCNDSKHALSGKTVDLPDFP